jgi:hypothetical protein
MNASGSPFRVKIDENKISSSLPARALQKLSILVFE